MQSKIEEKKGENFYLGLVKLRIGTIPAGERAAKSRFSNATSNCTKPQLRNRKNKERGESVLCATTIQIQTVKAAYEALLFQLELNRKLQMFYEKLREVFRV